MTPDEFFNQQMEVNRQLASTLDNLGRAIKGFKQLNAKHQLRPNPRGKHRAVTVSSKALVIKNELGEQLDRDTGYLLVQATDANARVTVNGTVPTASIGLQLKNGVSSMMSLDEFYKLRAIRESSTDVVLQIAEYYNMEQ
jgi:hypothetical protein